ncbi:hypothetical protein BaRGS_00024136 [Batillaria attramentaria]|uniref:Uncharacterized protein n=1 Tax=Batillaria attramentaria TaxID=370345 RepID=A0ABD0KC94_9CAEN
MQAALDEIRESLKNLATKDVFLDKIEKLEGRVFDLETEKDKLCAEVTQLKQDNAQLREMLLTESSKAEKRNNDHEQYHGDGISVSLV